MKEEFTELNDLIEDNMGFIIQTASQRVGRYINVGDDDVLSVAMLGFKEAYEKYDEDKGPFLAYAKLVMNSRIIDYMRKERKQKEMLSLDTMAEEDGFELVDERSIQPENPLEDEIKVWKEKLADFNITMEQLVEESPKHVDTRQRAWNISENSSQEETITKPFYEKKRLPIKLTATFNKVSEKVIQRSKTFISSGIIIFKEGYEQIINWVKRGFYE